MRRLGKCSLVCDTILVELLQPSTEKVVYAVCLIRREFILYHLVPSSDVKFSFPTSGAFDAEGGKS